MLNGISLKEGGERGEGESRGPRPQIQLVTSVKEVLLDFPPFLAPVGDS